jgi:hypothetical protein
MFGQATVNQWNQLQHLKDDDPVGLTYMETMPIATNSDPMIGTIQ